MKTTMKIAVVMVLVGAMAGLASASVVVTMNKAVVTGPGGEDVYDFTLTFAPADGEFTNAKLVVTMDAATIRDPLTSTVRGGTAKPVDTWVNTVVDSAYDMGTTVIFNTYKPLFPNLQTPPVIKLDWDFYDSVNGDNSTLTPSRIGRVLVDAGAVGTAMVRVWTTSNPGVPVEFNFDIPEPATMCLLGLGGIGVLIRRRRK